MQGCTLFIVKSLKVWTSPTSQRVPMLQRRAAVHLLRARLLLERKFVRQVPLWRLPGGWNERGGEGGGEQVLQEGLEEVLHVLHLLLLPQWDLDPELGRCATNRFVSTLLFVFLARLPKCHYYYYCYYCTELGMLSQSVTDSLGNLFLP